jgi:glycosyltransferase involved in cell wall biosynthesis
MPAGRLLNLVSFSMAASRYLRRLDTAVDAVVCETDPFLLPTVAAKYATRTQAKLACYLQDIYPDVAEAIGKVKPGAFTSQIRSRLRASYATADKVIVLGECMKQRLIRAPWSLNEDQIQIIPNWADCDSIRPLPKDKNPFLIREELTDKFVVMHSGNMGLTQRLDVLVRATQSDDWPDHAVLVLVGDGAKRQELEKQAELTPEGRIRFLPYQPKELLSESLSAADVHVVSMNESIAGCLCPSKLYGVLAAGKPVLAIAPSDTDLCQLVSKHALGWCAEPGDRTTINRIIASAAESHAERGEMGTRGREIALAKFNRLVVLKQLKAMLEDLTERTSQT